MIIPSSMRLREGESLEVEKEAEGLYTITNAYSGILQEFFKGRVTPIEVIEELPTFSVIEFSNIIANNKVPKEMLSLVDESIEDTDGQSL